MAEPLPDHVEQLLNQLGASVPTATESLVIRKGLLRLFLSVGHVSVRNRVEEFLKEHGTVQSVELSLDMIVATRARVLDRWPLWLAGLQVELCLGETHQVALDALITKAIREATREEAENYPQPTDEILDAACEQVARLREATRAPPQDLAKVIEGAFGVASDPTTLSRQAFVFSRLRRSALKLGVSLHVLETVVTPTIVQQLKQPLPEEIVGGVLELFDREIPFLVGHFSSAFALTVRESIPTAPWLAPPYKQQLDMAICRSLASTDPDMSSPLDPDSIATLTEAHGSEAATLCAHWVNGFSPGPGELATALATYVENGPPTPLRSALETRSRDFTPAERLQTVRGFLQASLETPVHPDFLDAVGFPESDQVAAADELVSMFERSSNDSGHDNVMALWGSLKPTDEEARTKLIDGVYIPMLKQSQAGFMVAYKHLALAISAPGRTLERLKGTLLDEADKYEYKRRVQKKLYAAGLLRKKWSILGDRYE